MKSVVPVIGFRGCPSCKINMMATDDKGSFVDKHGVCIEDHDIHKCCICSHLDKTSLAKREIQKKA